MDVDIDGHEKAMAIQNDLRTQYESISMAVETLVDDSECFTLELGKRRLLQEKQRVVRQQNEVNTSSAAAVFSSSSVQEPSFYSP